VREAAGPDFPVLAKISLVDTLRHGRVERSACSHCNVCVAEMDRDGARCVLPPMSPADKTPQRAHRRRNTGRIRLLSRGRFS
jgi:hypothetical protein